ncbi:F0F1 ATP synthase subunit delta [Rickettsia bellii]|uniref:ATP synthase subunit delta n=1 Tax=Rickettsia bellii str. RML An4 TaxID=1359193 RepID=A0A0F3QED0_RICBE|nr:ATP synthase F1 subunit delta [Rickettsia bellii]ARD85948.1 F0F1 ATP synthase subunit delta [Rickettsia bellii]KJV90607.1 ATP synthase F1, delta subunit [Rickettsia bellii str. RML An4]
MNKDILTQNYAVALFDNAKSDNAQDKILEEVNLVTSIIEDNIEVKELLSSPIVNKVDKIGVINSLVKNIKISKIMQNFLLLLIKNSRTSILADIANTYSKLLYESKNIKIVQVISANKLKPTEQEWVKTNIEKELKQETKINFEIDPTIMGGIVIKYDSILQDYSIKGSLDKIAKALQSVNVFDCHPVA